MIRVNPPVNEKAIGYAKTDEAILSPLGYGHINVLGQHSFTLAEHATKGNLRPLNQPTDND